MKDKLDLLKRKESTKSDLEIVYRRVADVKDEVKNLVDDLR